MVEKVRGKPGEGLNAADGEYGDLVAAGVIDPTMVTASALQNAASIAKNILTTEAIVAEPPEKEAGAGMPGGGMPDMGGMIARLPAAALAHNRQCPHTRATSEREARATGPLFEGGTSGLAAGPGTPAIGRG